MTFSLFCYLLAASELSASTTGDNERLSLGSERDQGAFVPPRNLNEIVRSRENSCVLRLIVGRVIDANCSLLKPEWDSALKRS